MNYDYLISYNLKQKKLSDVVLQVLLEQLNQSVNDYVVGIVHVVIVDNFDQVVQLIVVEFAF